MTPAPAPPADAHTDASATRNPVTERRTPPLRCPPLVQLALPIGGRRTRQVMWLTLVTMALEIVAGSLLGSMALLADGWHMSSHALALGVAAAAYALSRRHARDPRFAFGTWKIEVLGGYTSA